MKRTLASVLLFLMMTAEHCPSAASRQGADRATPPHGVSHMVTRVSPIRLHPQPAVRTIHFPDKSLGHLYWLTPESSPHLLGPKWLHLGEAKGTVRLPRKGYLMLKVGYAGAKEPASLLAYGPDLFSCLNFSRVEIDDRALADISALTGLRGLNLDSTDVTDEGLEPLASFKKLEDLNLARTTISDRGMKWLLPIKSLTWLWLDQTIVGDAGLKEIGQCHQLKNLSLSGCHITDAGLRSIADLTGLESLDLSCTRVTAAGLLRLSTLRSLRSLSLKETGVTARDLETMANLKRHLPHLASISVRDKSFTAHSLKEWRTALPHTKVEQK